ncbi:exosortase-associated EpsI family protein [Luteolibacter pohnpeiensis]|uniref:Exosortase-associated EpsI family protein n=1 Tax=Luteolibacter pohnpeiensis TaxID=454153 RepID=A0A934S4P7_9BACT|nr:exosortase-associated EpsI family protein [Luteolibacter pohnpeiensis]MBK1882491.1 exosortase-associated EpsI family protein [Luteolibacter pohnpeiensis]
MKFRLLILPLFLAGTLSAVYLLPQAGAIAQSAISMSLPNFSGKWVLKRIPPSQKELEVLAKDTQFAKAICLKPRPGEWTSDGNPVCDRVDLSIVLSGYDLNNSIHRPERCMPAQGHTILSSSDVKVNLKDGKEVTMRRLLSVQRVTTSDDRKQGFDLNCVTYYFFVGHDQLVYDHLTRTFVDMKDRLVRGMDQRWAYVSSSMWFGKIPYAGADLTVTEAEADQKLQSFLTDLLEEQIDWDQIKS